MDSKHFDQLSKAMGGRRHLLAGLFAAGLGGALGTSPPTAAKHHKHKHKKKGRCESDWACPVGELCKGGRCQPGCDPRTKDDCPTGMRCNYVKLVCAQECVLPGYYGPDPTPPLCPGGQVCHDGGGGGYCAPPCTSDQDCCYPYDGCGFCLTEFGSCGF
jgi:hypothetical protein